MKLGMLLRQFIKKFSTEARHKARVKIVSEGVLPNSRDYVDFAVNEKRLSAVFSNSDPDLVMLSSEIISEIPRDPSSLKALLTMGASLGSCRVSIRDSSVHVDYCRKARYFDYSEFVLAVDEILTALDILRNGLLAAHGLDSLDTIEEIGDASRLCMPRTRISSLLHKSVRSSYPEPLRGLFVRLVSCDDPWEASIRLIELNTVILKILLFAVIKGTDAMSGEPLLIEKGIASYSTREWHGILEILIDRFKSRLNSEYPALAGVLIDSSGKHKALVRDSMVALADFENLIFSTFKGEAEDAKLKETFTSALKKTEDLLDALEPLFRDSELIWDETRGFALKSGNSIIPLKPFASKIGGSDGLSLFHGRARGHLKALYVSHPGLEMQAVPAPPALEPLMSDHDANWSVFPGGAPGPDGHSGPGRGLDTNVLSMAMKESRWINVVSSDEFVAREALISVARKWGTRLVVPLPWSGVAEIVTTLANSKDTGGKWPTDLPGLVSRAAESLYTGPGNECGGKKKLLMVHWVEGCPGLVDYLERFMSAAPETVSLVTSSSTPLPGRPNLQCPGPDPCDMARILAACRRGVPVTREFFETLLARTRKEGLPFFTALMGEVMTGQLQANSPSDIPRDSAGLIKSLLRRTAQSEKGGLHWLHVCLAAACGGAVSSAEVEAVSGKKIQDLRSLVPEPLDSVFSTGTAGILFSESPQFAAGLAAGLSEEVDELKKEIYNLLESRTRDFGEMSKILARAGEAPGLAKVTRHLLSSDRRLRGFDFLDLKIHSEAGIRFSHTSPDGAGHFLSTRWAAIKGCELFFRLEMDRLVPDDRFTRFGARNIPGLSDPRVIAISAARGVRRFEAANPGEKVPEELTTAAAAAIGRLANSLSATTIDECLSEISSPEFCLAVISAARYDISTAAAKTTLARIAGTIGPLTAGNAAAGIASATTGANPGTDDWDAAFAAAIEEFPPAAAAALARYLIESPGWTSGKEPVPEKLTKLPPGPNTSAALSAALAPDDPALAADLADSIPEGNFKDMVNTRVMTYCRGAMAMAPKGVRKAIDHLNRLELKKNLWDIESRILAISDALIRISIHATGSQKKTILNHAFQLLEENAKYEGSAVERLNFMERLASMVDPMMDADMARGEEIYSKTVNLIEFTVSSGRVARLCMNLAIIARRRGLPGPERLVAKAAAMMKTMKMADEAGMLADMALFSLGDALAIMTEASETVQSAAIEKIVASLDPVKYQDICNSIVASSETQQSPTRRFRWLVSAMKASGKVSMKLGEALVPHLISAARQMRGEILKSGIEDILGSPGKFSIFVFIDLIRTFDGIPGPGEAATALARAYELNRLDRARVCDLSCEMFIRAMDRESQGNVNGEAELENAFTLVNPRERFLAISGCLGLGGGSARLKALQQVGMLSAMLSADPSTGRDAALVSAIAVGARTIPEPHCRKTLVRSLSVLGRAGVLSDPEALGILMKEGDDGEWLSRHPAWRVREGKSPGSEESAVDVLCRAELSPKDYELLVPRLTARDSRIRLLLSLGPESFTRVLTGLLSKTDTSTDPMLADFLKGARSISAHADEPDLNGIFNWKEGYLRAIALAGLLNFSVSIGYAGTRHFVSMALSHCRMRAKKEDHALLLDRMLDILAPQGDRKAIMQIIGHLLDEAGGLDDWAEKILSTGVMGLPWNQQAESFMRNAVMAALTQTTE